MSALDKYFISMVLVLITVSVMACTWEELFPPKEPELDDELVISCSEVVFSSSKDVTC